MTESFDALRKEAQIDRIELQRSITAGIDRVLEKMDEHNQHINDIDARVSVIEAQNRTFAKGFVLMMSGAFSALFGWAFSFFKHTS